jgi:hypothetical protein
VYPIPSQPMIPSVNASTVVDVEIIGTRTASVL